MKKSLFKGLLFAFALFIGLGANAQEERSVKFDMDDITMGAGDSIQVPIYLTTNNFDARDLQIFIKWPEKGIHPRRLSTGKYSASIVANQERLGTYFNEETGTYEPAYSTGSNYVESERESRFIVFSLIGAHLTSREGIIAYLTVVADEDFSGETELQFTSLKVTDDDAKGYEDLDRMATPVKVTGPAPQPAFDWNKVVLASYQIPSAGLVGEPVNVDASVTNDNTEAIAADTYSATLHVYNNEMTEDVLVDAPEIAAGGTNTYNFAWTPQTEGTYNAYVQFAFGEQGEHLLKSDVVEIVVNRPIPPFDNTKLTLTATATPNPAEAGEVVTIGGALANANETALENCPNVNLLVDGVEVAEQAGVAVPANGNATLADMSWTPAEAGTYKVKLTIEFDGFTLESNEIDLVVNMASTGVNDVNAGKTIDSIRYFNAAGMESAVPFQGINFVVTTYTDGSKTTSKVVK